MEFEINKLLNLSYKGLCNYLKQKYGKVKGNYFLDPSCKVRNDAIKKEGLLIHHIYDIKYGNLKKFDRAKRTNFLYQKGENLVYCNMLEHLLLHVRMSIENNTFENIVEVMGSHYELERYKDFITEKTKEYKEDIDPKLHVLVDHYKEYLWLLDYSELIIENIHFPSMSVSNKDKTILDE